MTDKKQQVEKRSPSTPKAGNETTPQRAGAQEKLRRDEHGEGNRAADRNYREATKEFVEEGKVEKNAEAAARALEGPEAERLERARRESAKGPRKAAPERAAGKKERQ